MPCLPLAPITVIKAIARFLMLVCLARKSRRSVARARSAKLIAARSVTGGYDGNALVEFAR